YKGPAQASVVIVSDRGSCGAGYRIARRYVIYGHPNKEGQFIHRACDRNYALAGNSADIRFLRGEQPTEEDLLPWDDVWKKRDRLLAESPASIAGRVLLPTGKIPQKIRVYIWEFETRTSAWRANVILKSDGVYRIERLMPGSYIVGAIAEGPDRTVLYSALSS